jgi:hypothetical protein
VAAPIHLRGDQADGYLATLRGLVAVARAGAHFPDTRRLDTHLSFLGPAGSRGTVAGLDIDPESGLPSLLELLRVRADRDLCDSFLAEHGDHLPAKAAYYRALCGTELAPASALEVRLCATRRGGARFEVVHDRLDAAGGCFLRYTFLLDQEGTAHIDLAAAGSVASEGFHHAIERCSGADSELALLLLAELDGLRVLEVIRGQLGPLHFAAVPGPALVRAVLREIPGAFVLHLAVERAGAAVTTERCRDPFARPYREALDPAARALIEARRAALGYRVARDRRLVCTPAAEAPLRTALRQAGVPLVVRST